MEEREILQQVMQYAKSLAEGVDPVGGEAVPAGSILRGEEMVRRFRYVSDVLREELTGEEEPVRLSAFLAETTIALGFTGYRYYLNAAATEWLISEGDLTCERDSDGKPDLHRCSVTPKGSRAGLSESEPYEDGYVAVLCGWKAQELLRGRLNQLMAHERAQWEPVLSCLTAEWGERVECVPDLVVLKELLERVNSQLPAGLPRKFSAQAVVSWLTRNGIFEISVLPDGRRLRSVTETGKAAGFHSRDRLSVQAQRFVLEHLETIARDLASGEAFRLPEPSVKEI